MDKTKRIIFLSISCAMAIVLDYIKAFIPFLNMPSGGSINIALIPIVVCSFCLGMTDGILCGLLWWLVSSVLGLNPYFKSIIQYIVDYVLPSAAVGLCSIFYHKKNIFEIEFGILLMMLVRTILVVISGTYFWTDNVASGSLEALSISLIYNVPYNALTLIMLLIIIPLIIRSLKKYMV